MCFYDSSERFLKVKRENKTSHLHVIGVILCNDVMFYIIKKSEYVVPRGGTD